MIMDKPLVLVSWNGQEAPLRSLLHDGDPNFDLLLFDYSGQVGNGSPVPHALPATLLSERTQCKGDIYQALARHLGATGCRPRFVGLIDDDVILSVNDINRLLHLGECHDLHVFSAALSHDSEYTHRWTLQQPSRVLRQADWVEVMMPFYRGDLFLAGATHYEGNISSWGIDRYLMPTLQQLSGLTRTFIIDAVMASHVRPITSGQTTYRNGLTARQEAERMKQRCLQLLTERQPALLGSEWFHRIFERRHYRSRWQQLAYGLGRRVRRWLDQST